MSGDPQHSGDRITASAAPGGRFEDVELHRVDLAARLLALKHAALAAEALIEHAAAETRGLAVELDAVMFIAEMVRVSALRLGDEDGARSLLAAERLAELLAALEDPADAVALRGLRRRGELDRPLPMPAQRRIRRACWRVRPADGAAATLEPLPTPVWDGLLDALARSLAIDRDAEVWADVGLDGLAEAELAARRDRVRAALLRGAQRPIERSSGRGLAYLDSEPALATGGEQAAPHARELLPAGHRVGRFTLLHRLGVGAMGVVYAAYDPELDRRIAVKLLRARAGPGAARAQARLLREAQAMARLTHPNVAVVHDVGTHEGAVFVAMEFVRGATLQAWLRAAPRSWREVVDVFLQAGRGLAAAHAAGLVHRELKPPPCNPASQPDAPPISKDFAGLQGRGLPRFPPPCPGLPLFGGKAMAKPAAPAASRGRSDLRAASLVVPCQARKNKLDAGYSSGRARPAWVRCGSEHVVREVEDHASTRVHVVPRD